MIGERVDGDSDQLLALQAVEVVASEFAIVEAVMENVPGGNQNGMGNGHDRSFVTRRFASRPYCAAI